MASRPTVADPRRILDAIRGHLAGGLRLDEPVAAFIASTYGVSGAGELSALLADADAAETEPLLELLFFPDEALQQALETVLDGQALDPGAFARVGHSLRAAPAVAVFTVPGAGGRVSMPLRPDGVAAFLDRLHLQWGLGDLLRPAVDAAFPTGGEPGPCSRWAVLVRLRNAAVDPSPFQADLLTRFFSGFPADRDDYLHHLDFLLKRLADAPEAEDGFAFLVGRRAFFHRQLQQARKAMALLEKFNMETLAMSGFRMPAMDTETAIRGMEAVDTLAIHLFGRWVPREADPVAVDLGEVADLGDLDRISRLLSE